MRAKDLRTAIKIILKNDRRGGRINTLLAHPPVLLAECEPAFSFPAREPLVLQRDWERGPRRELARKPFDASCHVGRSAIEASRQADDDGNDAVFFTRKARNLVGSHLDGVHIEPARTQHAVRPRQRPGDIGHRHADAPLTDIEPDDPHALTLY